MRTEDIQHATSEGIEKTILDVQDSFPAGSLEESIDALITTERVVMFEKTWCLFSRDAKEFLRCQLGVSLTTVPVDLCKNGDAVAHYVKHKTHHRTFPYIFVQGDFLGGFEEVNNLYSTGELQKAYLSELTQADRCEMELRELKSPLKPLFWFPEKVNANVVRLTGVLTCVSSLLACAFSLLSGFNWGPYIAYGVWLDFFLRILAGTCLSPLGRLATVLTWPMEPKPRVGRPKQFAACCGFLFAMCGSVSYLVNFPSHTITGSVFMGMLAIATGMEGVFDFCLGCAFFKIGIQLGLIPQ